LKDQYDVIIKDWIFPAEDSTSQEIFAEVYFFPTADQQELPKEIKFEGETTSGYFNKENIKYFNWGIPLTFAAYGIIFWDWGSINSFRTHDEGWFSKGTYAGGADKFAHIYSHFLITRLGFDFYRRSGFSHSESVNNSFLLGVGIGFLIEVGDGISNYGFGVNDIISDMVGIGLGTLLNISPYLDELIGFQMHWWNNTNFKYHRRTKIRDPIDDYNNQKYILNFRFSAVPILHTLPLIRYLNFDIGFYSRGFEDPEEKYDYTKREIFTGFSLNLTQLLQDLYPLNDYSYYGGQVFKYYQPPFTGFEMINFMWRSATA
jgi:hypothetical protein